VSEDSQRAYIGYANDCLLSVVHLQTREKWSRDKNLPNLVAMTMGVKDIGEIIFELNPKTILQNLAYLEKEKAFQGDEICDIVLNPVDSDSILLNVNRVRSLLLCTFII